MSLNELVHFKLHLNLKIQEGKDCIKNKNFGPKSITPLLETLTSLHREAYPIV
jgi:hypothetical protein